MLSCARLSVLSVHLVSQVTGDALSVAPTTLLAAPCASNVVGLGAKGWQKGRSLGTGPALPVLPTTSHAAPSASAAPRPSETLTPIAHSLPPPLPIPTPAITICHTCMQCNHTFLCFCHSSQNCASAPLPYNLLPLLNRSKDLSQPPHLHPCCYTILESNHLL